LSRFARYSHTGRWAPGLRYHPWPTESWPGDTLEIAPAALSGLPAATCLIGLKLPFGAGALGYLSYDFARLENPSGPGSADVQPARLQMGIYA